MLIPTPLTLPLFSSFFSPLRLEIKQQCLFAFLQTNLNTMKSTHLLLIIYFALLIAGCKKSNDEPTLDTCKLKESDRVGKLTYDDNGRAATMATSIYLSATATTPATVLGTLSYDGNGKLTKTIWTLDGKANSEETYTYTNGRITKINFAGPNSPTGVNNLTYDDKGRLTRYSVEPNGQLQFAQNYAYNADGILIEKTVTDPNGGVAYKGVTKPIGSVKSAEQLAISRGLPFVMTFGDPLVVAEGAIGTVFESYSLDNTGKLTLDYTAKVTSQKINAKGYLVEQTVVDQSNSAYTQTVTLADCN